MSLEKIIELQKSRMSLYGASSNDTLYNTTFEDFEGNPAYRIISHNDVEIGVHFITKTGKFRHQEIYAITKPPYKMDVGDYIYDEYGILWMCYGVSQFPIRKHYLDMCNHNLKFIDSNNNLITKPCIVSAKTLYTTGVKDEKVIEIPNGMVGIQLPYDDDTKKLDRKQSFVFNKTKYEITFYNEVEFDGLVILICSETALSNNDDKVNEIADRWIDVTGGGKIDRLPWLDNQEPPIEPEPETPPTEGTTYTITVKTPTTGDNPDELWYGETYIYTVHKLVDDVEVEGNYTFEIDNTDLATISNTTNNSCSITAKEVMAGGMVKLIVTDTETSTVAIEKEIKIIGR